MSSQAQMNQIFLLILFGIIAIDKLEVNEHMLPRSQYPKNLLKK